MAAVANAEPKSVAWEDFGEAMENDFLLVSKRFWKTIQQLRRVGGDSPKLCSAKVKDFN